MEELAHQFSELARQYGPAVADAAKQAARVEAYSTLVSGTLTIIAAAVIFGIAFVLHRVARRNDWDDVIYAPIFIVCVVGSVTLAVGICSFADPWTWVAINHPELWLAKRAFNL